MDTDYESHEYTDYRWVKSLKVGCPFFEAQQLTVLQTTFRSKGVLRTITPESSGRGYLQTASSQAQKLLITEKQLSLSKN